MNLVRKFSDKLAAWADDRKTVVIKIMVTTTIDVGGGGLGDLVVVGLMVVDRVIGYR